mmetsp:Transcript_15571/g.46114  ORF Transcript_15571/g.46114 Transcript_15571/m.46114 type:complete len:229 (+) Transcript_15571:281-967(+)
MRRCHFSGIRTCLAEGPYCAAVGTRPWSIREPSRCCNETTESSSMRMGGTVWFAASPESGSRWSGTLPVARRSARLPASSRFSSSAIAARAALATAASFCCGPLGRVCGLQHRSASSSQRDVWSCFWRDGSACSATWGGRRERSWLRRSFTEFSLRRRLETDMIIADLSGAVGSASESQKAWSSCRSSCSVHGSALPLLLRSHVERYWLRAAEISSSAAGESSTPSPR